MNLSQPSAQFNPNHLPPGSPDGGEFAPGGGSGAGGPEADWRGVESSAHAPGLAHVEENLFSLPQERMVAWKGGRKVLTTSVGGYGDRVQLSTADTAKLQEADVVTHNHPSGASFSEEDFHIARELQINELRAVGMLANGDHVVYRAVGLKRVSRTRLEKAIQVNRARKPVGGIKGRQVESHSVNKKIAAKAGFKYERYINGKLAP